MLNNYTYTEKEQKKILESINILVDKREKNNKHILQWLDSKKISYKNETLDYGDYSFFIPKNEELHIFRDYNFKNLISIERKNSTDEIVGNFAQDRNRFEDELLRHKGKMFLLIEDEEFYKKICNGLYKSKYNHKSALGTYHSFINRYSIFPSFIDKKYSGLFIYMTFYYFLRDYIKS